jgi:serum/glucocorticoid-regulated kinase 2
LIKANSNFNILVILIGILHRNIKAESVFVSPSGHVILSDFFTAKLEGSKRWNDFCGTPEYLAPEVLLGDIVTYAVDWWSFGMISLLK